MSGRPCASCSDPRRPEIDAALVAGQSFRVIARQFAPLSHDAIRRHRPHIGKALVRAAERRGERTDETLLDKVRALEADAHRLKQKAEEQDDVRAALVAVDKLLDVIRLQRELMPPPAVDVRAVAERIAAAAGVPADELLELAEKFAQVAGGKNPPDFGLIRAIESAAIAARELPAASPLAAPADAPPPVPFRMTV